MPKTVGTVYKKALRGGLRACNNLPQPLPTSRFLGGCGRLLHALNPPRSAFLYTVPTVFGTVSSLHPISFLMIFIQFFINNNHVLLTFTFDTPVTLTFVEMDFFLCPEWNINAPYVTIYGGGDVFVLNSQGTNSDFIASYRPSNTSCGCLSTVSVPLQLGEPSYAIWHIIVSFYYQPEAEWVHIGEIRFPNKPLLSDSVPTTFCRIPDTPPSEFSHMLLKFTM